ncbi:hypothetical protein [Sediminibacterium ginsengisoli]|uniref:Uncharacterized protein n=1 Tax=Sediminibacterium ginsengisoli TaxID=413434 RepID=A0A1T4K9P7_9BACT|nr:hypothetical protein [Sediminibacterium ginsengisoli]SJZ39035.1 hypothetical protein SAMN04488132_101547 [Sediminibacterium ginsengisoli]
MKKKVCFSALLIGVLLSSCTKNNDFIKTELEKALPSIELTSLGLMLQTGPFAQTDVIQVTFGGAVTQSEAGTFDIAWYDAPSSGTAKLVDSVHFNSWTETAATSNANNAIATTSIPTSYPNTTAFAGNLLLKLTKLPAGNKSYTLRAYARTKDNKMAAVSVSKLITIK